MEFRIAQSSGKMRMLPAEKVKFVADRQVKRAASSPAGSNMLRGTRRDERRGRSIGIIKSPCSTQGPVNDGFGDEAEE